MRRAPIGFFILLWFVVHSGLISFGQNKTACELLSKGDAEAVLGATLQPLKPLAPFRSELADKDFQNGKMGEGCSYNNVQPGVRNQQNVVSFILEVRYWATPDLNAVPEMRKHVDERTYDDPVDIPGLGDAAFSFGDPNNMSLIVFHGGTMAFLIGPSTIGLEKEKVLALRVLAGLGKTNVAYRASSSSLPKPELNKPGLSASALDKVKHDLTAKAEAGDAKAELVLGQLYQFGFMGTDAAKPDYAAAAYWYQEAANRGSAQAAYQLAVIYRDGRGVAANAPLALEFFLKAANAGYVPAMVPLSYAYGTSDSPVRLQRATYWAHKAADAGDPKGWLILGYAYYRGWLILDPDPTSGYRQAMINYKKAAAGGDCLAMLNIGGLYFNGEGVAQSRTQAQTWFAKAESCQGANLDWIRERAAKYRQRAAAGDLPVPAATANSGPGRAGLSDGQKLVAGLAAMIVVAAALDLLNNSSGKSSGTDPAVDMNTLSGQSSVSSPVPWTPPFNPFDGHGILGQPCWPKGQAWCQ
jgi:TPR repeat protein